MEQSELNGAQSFILSVIAGHHPWHSWGNMPGAGLWCGSCKRRYLEEDFDKHIVFILDKALGDLKLKIREGTFPNEFAWESSTWQSLYELTLGQRRIREDGSIRPSLKAGE